MSHRPVVYVLVLALITVILAALMCSWAPESPEAPDEPVLPEYPFDNQIPEGFSFDQRTNILSATETVSWHIFDMYHTFMEDRYTEYHGTDIVSEEVKLAPGGYVITVGDEEFEVRVAGDVERTFSWKYRMGDVTEPVSVFVSISMEEFMEACDSNRVWNRETIAAYTFMPFEQLPRLVVVDDVIRSLESSLEEEFVRIGGDLNDRQGFADFMACFVQLGVKYPSSVSKQSFDYFVWGSDEYWCIPLETLYHKIGDCEDTSALLCALYLVAGYDAAMGGHSGHVFAGVAIEDFQDRVLVDHSYYKPSYAYGIIGFDIDGKPVYGDVLYHSVETIRGQIPVGYLATGNDSLDKKTFWGYAGFYPVSG